MRHDASILIVDDEVDTCRNLADIFSDMGFRVDMAHEGRTAIEKVRTARYDLVILDLMMPGMDGLAVYQEIKQIRPETVAVLATAYSNHPRAEQSISVGVWQLVPKPVDVARLLSIVDEAASQQHDSAPHVASDHKNADRQNGGSEDLL